MSVDSRNSYYFEALRYLALDTKFVWNFVRIIEHSFLQENFSTDVTVLLLTVSRSVAKLAEFSYSLYRAPTSSQGIP